MIASEFICKCKKTKGWIYENRITRRCPSCGRRYKGVYCPKKLTLLAIEINKFQRIKDKIIMLLGGKL